MQNLSNRIIDLEKGREAQKNHKPYYPKREDNNQWQVPPPHLPLVNITEVGGDNFCTFHQQPHLEKKCPQWLNSITLVMNQLLDSKVTKNGGKDQKKNQAMEK